MFFLRSWFYCSGREDRALVCSAGFGRPRRALNVSTDISSGIALSKYSDAPPVHQIVLYVCEFYSCGCFLSCADDLRRLPNAPLSSSFSLGPKSLAKHSSTSSSVMHSPVSQIRTILNCIVEYSEKQNICENTDTRCTSSL